MTAADGASLSARTIRAGIWTVGARLSSRLIDFAVLLVLARLLGPADFGLVATAMTVIYIVEAILELPLTFVLVRLPQVTDRMYDTAFTLGLIRGLLVAGLMAALSWPLASLYGDPRLMPLICTLALAPAARGLISPRMVIFEKALDFRRKGALELLGKAAAGAIAIFIAVSTGNYWAVAAGTISAPVVMMIVSYVMAPMRPRLSLADWPIFSNMTGWNFLSQIVSALNWQVDRLILPIYIDVTSFGRFTTANDIAGLPFQAIVQPTAVPLFSALVNAREKGSLVGAYLKACSGIVMLMAPVMCFIALMAGPVIHILLGPAWASGAPILAGVVVGIIFYGISGAIAAKAGAGVALLLMTLYSVRSVAGIPIRDQLRSSLYPMVALVPAVAFLYGVPDLTQSGPYLYPAIAVVGLVYGMLYVAGLYGLWWVTGRPDGLESYLAGKATAYFRR